MRQVWPCVTSQSLDKGSVPFGHNKDPAENSSVQEEPSRETKKVAYNLKTPQKA